MKVKVMLINRESFDLDIEPDMTINKVKEVIKEKKGFEVEHQKIIFKSAILDGTQTVSGAGITENSTFVCLYRKPGGASPSPAPSPAPAPAPAPTPAPAGSPAPAPAPAPAAAASAGPEVEVAVKNLCDLGYPEDQVRAAMRAAYNNPERAFEYLSEGIPEHLQSLAAGGAGPAASDSSTAATSGTAPTSSPAPTSAPAPSPSSAPTSAPAPAPVSTSATGDRPDPMEALRRLPNLDQLRRLVQNDPSKIDTVIDSIGRINPTVYSFIQQNREAFVAMLNEPVGSSGGQSGAGGALGDDGDDGEGDGPGVEQYAIGLRLFAQSFPMMPQGTRQQIIQATQSSEAQVNALASALREASPSLIATFLSLGSQAVRAAASRGASGASGGPPGSVTVTLTQEDRAAINRIMEIVGAGRDAVIRAYIACDRNEEQAIGLLLEGGLED